MFEQSFLPLARTGKRWYIAAALAGQMLLVGVLLVIPLLYVQVLPIPELTTLLLPGPEGTPPPPPPPAAAALAPPPGPKGTPARVPPRRFDASIYTPRAIPKTVAAIRDLPQAPAIPESAGGVAGGVPGGEIGGVLGAVLGSVPSAALPGPEGTPPPPPPAKPAEAPKPGPATADRIKVGGEVQAGLLVNAPPPAYPPLAKQAHIFGVVRLKAVISSDGRVESLTTISGSPMLVPAAIAAVKQWVYRPTFLNGKAVQVDTEIDVNFRLG